MTTFDCTPARTMLEVLSQARATGTLSEQWFDAALATPGYRLFMDHHNRFSPGSFTHEHFRVMLDAAVRGDKGYIPPKPGLSRMFEAFSSALGRLEELTKLAEQVEQIGWQEQATARARRWLPNDADLSAEVCFLLDGYSGGYVLGRRIGMDLLQYDGRLKQLEGVIAHELHHVGFASLLGRSDKARAEAMEARLAGLFIGEGSATALVYGRPQPGDEGYEEWQQHERKMAEYFKLTRDYLARITEGAVRPEEFERDVPAMYLRGRWGVGYAVGAAMVTTVLRGLGKEALFDCMRRPETFVATYRLAVARLRAAGAQEQLCDL